MYAKQKYDCNAVLEYLNKLFDEINYGFKFFENGNSTILSTSFGVQLNFLLKNLTKYPICKISTVLKRQQNNKSGLFVDNNFDMKQIVRFEEEYILWQFTYFVTIALDMLGEKPQYSYYFLDDLKNIKSLEKWFEKQDFRNFWYTSNKIMFLLYFLTYEKERLNIDNHELVTCLFDLIDSNQDADTGFWGTSNGASLENGMYGAAHIYLYYDFYGQEINYKDKIVNNVIKLQNSYGLFGSKFGGACEDYNAIEILSILIKHYDYKHDIIKKAINKIYNTILINQNKDGGFSYSIDNRSLYERLKDKISGKEYWYSYSGWDKMRSKNFKPDLWGTYFRILTIAKIEKILEKCKYNRYKFYSLPGWGF